MQSYTEAQTPKNYIKNLYKDNRMEPCVVSLATIAIDSFALDNCLNRQRDHYHHHHHHRPHTDRPETKTKRESWKTS